MTPEQAVVVAASLLAIPWAAWVSKMLVTIHGDNARAVNSIADHERRLADLEQVLPRHVPPTHTGA